MSRRRNLVFCILFERKWERYNICKTVYCHHSGIMSLYRTYVLQGHLESLLGQAVIAIGVEA